MALTNYFASGTGATMATELSSSAGDLIMIAVNWLYSTFMFFVVLLQDNAILFLVMIIISLIIGFAKRQFGKSKGGSVLPQ